MATVSFDSLPKELLAQIAIEELAFLLHDPLQTFFWAELVVFGNEGKHVVSSQAFRFVLRYDGLDASPVYRYVLCIQPLLIRLQQLRNNLLAGVSPGPPKCSVP